MLHKQAKPVRANTGVVIGHECPKFVPGIHLHTVNMRPLVMLLLRSLVYEGEIFYVKTLL